MLSHWAVITLISTLHGCRELYGNCTSSASLAGVAGTRKMSQPSVRPSHSSALLKPSLPQINHCVSPVCHSLSVPCPRSCTEFLELKIPPHQSKHTLLLNCTCSLPKVPEIHPFSQHSAFLTRRSHLTGGSRQVLHCCLQRC